MKEFDGLKKMEPGVSIGKKGDGSRRTKRTSSSLAAYKSTTARLFIDYNRRDSGISDCDYFKRRQGELERTHLEVFLILLD